jgi:hypothetical protein
MQSRFVFSTKLCAHFVCADCLFENNNSLCSLSTNHHIYCVAKFLFYSIASGEMSVLVLHRKRSVSFTSFASAASVDSDGSSDEQQSEPMLGIGCARSPSKRRRQARRSPMLLLRAACRTSDCVAQSHFVLLCQLSQTLRTQHQTASANPMLNRYPNVLANEATRVRLAPPPARSLAAPFGASNSDYINANHIALQGSPTAFILVSIDFRRLLVAIAPLLAFFAIFAARRIGSFLRNYREQASQQSFSSIEIQFYLKTLFDIRFHSILRVFHDCSMCYARIVGDRETTARSSAFLPNSSQALRFSLYHERKSF